jgi:hypothetical protein
VGEVAGQFVLKSQFLFLEAVEEVFVGVASMLFFLDQGVKSGMLRFQFLDSCRVHWRVSFPQSQCQRNAVNHESGNLSRPLSRLVRVGARVVAKGGTVPAEADLR